MTTVTTHFASVAIVDDTPDVRLVLRLVLERYEGVVVVGEAGDGESAVALVSEHRPEVVLLDLAMPRMDGLQALPLIRAASPDTRVIVLSGFETERMAGAALAAGAHRYVRKGAAPEQLVGAITEVLGRTAPPTRIRATRRRAPVAPGTEFDAPHSEPAPPVENTSDPHRLIARAAHELRNPAIALTMLAEELGAHRNALKADMVERIVNAIVRQASIVDQVTTDLLTSSHARRGSLVVNPRPIRLRAALVDVVETFDGGPRSEIHVDCPDDLVVRADKVRLHQQITNLLTNAVKYGEPPIEIHARATGDGDGMAEIRVRDHGPGVPEWFRGQLFDEYARATPQHGVGTGIGLFVVRSIAQAQGGDAWYEASGSGAVFCLSVPVEVAVPAIP